MLPTSRTSFRFASVLLLALALLLTGLPTASAESGNGGGGGDDDGGGGGHEVLKLRANDAVGKPGGIVAIVLRTYAARPIRQGQISVRVGKGRPAAIANAPNVLTGPTVEALTQPLQPLTFLSAVVYSTRGDSATQANPVGAAGSQAVNVQFSSPSATVNASDGPLAVLRFRLHPAVTPGQEFTIEVDPALTSLVDSGGQAIQIEPINAVLTVRAPSAPFAVESEGDDLEPGETAELGLQTFEPFRVSSGKVTLRYNPAIAAGPPVVRMDPRYGKATFTVTRPRRGVLVVDFQSPDKTLNNVPGTIVAVSLPTRASTAIGTESPVTLDAAGTWLKNPKGQKYKLTIENGSLVFE
ncbi:MAG TPA: hypothetical protein VKM72_26630 [Thermoanaerobaculia bacterium]|nr:hypothetical protein [Thermoanaerobaculia bacterium]